ALAADQFTLYDRDAETALGQCARTVLSRRPGAQDDDVVLGAHLVRSFHLSRSCWPPSMSYVAPVKAVLIIKWTASAATSDDWTTRPIGSVDRSSSRRASSWSPSSDADSGVSTNPAAIRLTRTGATSTARLAARAGSAAVIAELRPMPRLGWRAAV